jgi:alpha-galactosidase
MKNLKIALIGAGSRDFGPSMVRDIMVTETLFSFEVEVVLMDIVAAHLTEIAEYAQYAAKELKRKINISTTTDLKKALTGAHFVISAIEVERYKYWAMDFHIPRRYGFRQIYGENGGVGGIFHALRNIPPILHIAQTMEKVCPDALLLNFSNPEQKVVEALTRLTKIKVLGLCHGVFMGLDQIADILEMKKDDLWVSACGMNHFTFFQKIQDKKTGKDLYPLFREKEKAIDRLYDWHELALGRVLLNLYGLWPSPGTNHYGEYIQWADEFMASNMHWYYDPINGEPWKTNNIPEFIYTIDKTDVHTKVKSVVKTSLYDKPLVHSGETAIPIVEGLACNIKNEILAVVATNHGKMPQMPADAVVEVPAWASGNGIETVQMDALPESLVEMMRQQATINKLLVEAFVEKSKSKLLQVILLDPTVNSYQNAVIMLDEMLSLQKGILPEFK